MVSRREKLKLKQSKDQEQMFNLHVQLMDLEVSAGERTHCFSDWTEIWGEKNKKKKSRQEALFVLFPGCFIHRLKIDPQIIFNIWKSLK